MTLKELKKVIGTIGLEGFQYTFGDYSDFSEIKDKNFHKVRLQFNEATEALEDYLREQCEESDVEYDDLLE